MFKKYIYPLFIILMMSIGLRFLDGVISDNYDFIIIILRCILLFYFGVSLSYFYRNKNQKWFKKLVISFIVLFLLLYELGYILAPQIINILDTLGFKGYIIYLVYIYCGYCFFD